MNSIRFTMHYRVKPMKLGRCEDQNFKILEELVDKETPMKLEETDVETDKDCFNWICPRCKSFHSESEGYQYCSECGQKIDWSDYEKYLREGEQEEN